MAESRFSVLGALFAPRVVKIGALLWFVFAGYDTLCSQFGLPTVGSLAGRMSGTLLPWWGWQLILQAIFVYALFEYVRRNVTRATDDSLSAASERAILKMRGRIGELDELYKKVIHDYQNMNGVEIRLTDAFDKYKEHMRGEIKKLEDRFSILERRVTEVDEVSGKGFGRVFLAFSALLAREKVQRFMEHITREGEFLMHRIAEGQPLKGDDWKRWETHHVTFESAIRGWLDIAQGWHPKIEEWINKVPTREDLTADRWAGIDDLIEGSNRSTTYKMFVFKYEQWFQYQGTILNAIHLAAFNPQNATDILGEAYRTGSTIEGV